MSSQNGRDKAYRLIARDQAIREAGKTPLWTSVHQVLEYVCQQQLLTEPAVTSWLHTLANGADLWFSHRLLKIVGTLLDNKAFDDAHALYRVILGMDDVTRWQTITPALVTDSMIVQAGITPILGRSGLLAGHPQNWGRTACELLGQVVREHQKENWSSHLHALAIIAETKGDRADADQPFRAQEDDCPTLWYFAPDHPDAPRYLLAQAIDQGVRDAAASTDATAFRLFAVWLVELHLAIGSGLLLSSLLDGLTGKLSSRAWHAGEAVRLLSLDAVQRPASLGAFRRILRRALPQPDADTAASLTDVIRRSDLPEWVRLRELADVGGWGILQAEEQQQVAEAAARDELRSPADPREEPIVRLGESTWLPSSVAGREWPHDEDDHAIRLLSSLSREPRPAHGEDVTPEILEERLEALQALLSRQARDSEGWFGDILGWCHRCIQEVRTQELHRLGRDPKHETLSAAEWEHLLIARAPWWRERVGAALGALSKAVPGYHRQRRPDELFWPTSDPILQSLGYLDEVLAVEGDEPFASLRRQLEAAINQAWPAWPAFTRATALSVLRGWYWRNLTQLRGRLSELIEHENDPIAVRYAVERLLMVGGPDFGANLERFLGRAPSIESSGQMVNRLGQALGHAFLLSQGQSNPGEGVQQLAALYARVQQSPPTDPATRDELIRGILFGAMDLLKDDRSKSEVRAVSWAAMVCWACSAWTGFSDIEVDKDRFPILPVMMVLARPWPNDLRSQLMGALNGPFLRIARDGTLGDFCWLHHELIVLLRGDGQGASSRLVPLSRGEVSGTQLLELCRASAERVLSWRRVGTTSQDLLWDSAITGQQTADLIRTVVNAFSDRDYLRRELPPIIDCLAQAGNPVIATELRLLLRRR